MDKIPSFGNGNYYVCLYCKNLMIFQSLNGRFDDLDENGCVLEKDSNNKYPNLDRYEKRTDDLSLIEKGCNNFVSSGLPAHPVVLEELIKINPLTKNIPLNIDATEEGFEFVDKIKLYISKEQIVRGKDLVYNAVLSSENVLE